MSDVLSFDVHLESAMFLFACQLAHAGVSFFFFLINEDLNLSCHSLCKC